ncbi:hypothetical protein [Williamsia sp.]|uniref:hypothetical protein n=1 Tax=Williamsia sp. TaxID=1872085 RepID=UPI002F9299F9
MNQIQTAPRLQYGEPVRIDDQTTVIPVSRRTIRGGSTPIGLYTVTNGETVWTPAIDGGRIALIGVLTGLIAATLGTAAVFKQPPWPRMTIVK